MRFILILIVALALTLTWQSTVFATFTFDSSDLHSCTSTKADKKKGSGEEEPECE